MTTHATTPTDRRGLYAALARGRNITWLHRPQGEAAELGRFVLVEVNHADGAGRLSDFPSLADLAAWFAAEQDPATFPDLEVYDLDTAQPVPFVRCIRFPPLAVGA